MMNRLVKNMFFGSKSYLLTNMSSYLNRKMTLFGTQILIRPGLLGTSSPFWISEALATVPKVIADVLVFVNGLRGLRYKAGVSGRKQGIWKSMTANDSAGFFTYSPIHTNAARIIGFINVVDGC